MTNHYLTILQESLRKKSGILDKIREFNERQFQVFQNDEVSLEAYDHYADEKGELIEELTKLDDGFEVLYDKIREELLNDRERYADQIGELQTLVKEVVEKSVSVQAQETRNKRQVEQYFQKAKADIGNRRRTSAAAMNYYKNMSNTNAVPPQFMDRKK